MSKFRPGIRRQLAAGQQIQNQAIANLRLKTSMVATAASSPFSNIDGGNASAVYGILSQLDGGDATAGGSFSIDGGGA